MRWAHAAVPAVVCSLSALLAACGSTIDSETNPGAATGSHATGGGQGGTGGNTSNGGADPQGGGGQGGAPDTTTTGGGGSGGAPYPAPHPAPPTVLDLGGPKMTAQKVVPVFFGNDDGTFTTQVRDFLSKMQSSTYFASAAAEYGIGAVTMLPAIQLAESATGTISDDQLQAWLVDKIEAEGSAFPAPDMNTLYLLFYPSGVTITDFGGTSCTSFDGYHFNTHLHDGTAAIYAVIPRCPGGQGESAMDLLTSSTSHEMLEAATDPMPYDDTAYGQLDDAHYGWEFIVGAEIGDLCALTQSGFSTFPDMPYLVQRAWSNASAAAGHDPCVPIVPHKVYFNSAPELNDDVVINGGPDGSVTTKGVNIGIGETKTIDVDLFSDAPTDGEWSVQPYDGNALFGASPNLDLTIVHDTGKNGDKLKLQIKVLKRGEDRVETFILYSSMGNDANLWVGMVGTP